MSAIKKILLTGAGGQLGSYLEKRLAGRANLLALRHSGAERPYQLKADIRDTVQLKKIFTDFQPDVVIHTAALSRATPGLYGKKDLFDTNVTATADLAKFCAQADAKLIYTSTDLVYAGYRGTLLNEDSKLVPATPYAETKLMGEIKIQRIFNNYIILRTALLIGKPPEGRENFFHKMVLALKSGKGISLFYDQYRSPLALHDAARIIDGFIEKDISGKVINFGGGEKISRLELGKKFCQLTGLNNQLINPVSMRENDQVVPVTDVSMSIGQLHDYKLSPEPLDIALQKIAKDYGLI